MPKVIWSDDMVAFVKVQYKTHSLDGVAQLLNERFGTSFNADQVRALTKNRRIHCCRARGEAMKGKFRLLTPAQAQFVKDNYALLGRKGLHAALTEKFGADITLYQLIAFVKNNGIKSGRTGYFQPGQLPHNAGTKGIMKANAGSFKRGNRPVNAQPVGTIVEETKDRYYKIKMAEPNTWEFLHRHIWEQHNGPIPEGAVISFIDGNNHNCDLANLELIDRSELGLRNRSGFYSVPAELRPVADVVVKLRLKTGEARRRLAKAKERAA